MNLQDVLHLQNTLMLVGALMLSFAVTLHVGTFDHEQLIEADLRYQLMKSAQAGKPIDYEKVDWGPLSNQMLYLGYSAELSFIGALLFGALSSLSLTLSGVNEKVEEHHGLQHHLYERWLKVFMPWTLLDICY